MASSVLLAGGSFVCFVFTNLLTSLRGRAQWLTRVVEVRVSALYDVDTESCVRYQNMSSSHFGPQHLLRKQTQEVCQLSNLLSSMLEINREVRRNSFMNCFPLFF